MTKKRKGLRSAHKRIAKWNMDVFFPLSFQLLVPWDPQPTCCTLIWHQCSPSSTTSHTAWQSTDCSAGSASLYFVPQSHAWKNHISQPNTNTIPKYSKQELTVLCNDSRVRGLRLNYMCTLNRFFMVFKCMFQIYIAFLLLIFGSEPKTVL